MEDLVNASVNKILNSMVDTAICEAIRLQIAANDEYEKQKQNADAGKPYNFKASNAYRDGVRALGHCLQTLFGDLPVDCIRAIEKIVGNDRGDDALGYDSRDYVKLFREALEAEKK